MDMNWIEANKQPPDADGRYLACYGSVFIAQYTKSTNTWKRECSTSGLAQMVSHWMPLPEPPKK
ncbi:MAG: hypothetical protein A3F13_04920 [Gammaproteobacteria bacterium RIFCSPHIGHO2_12_FULL_40_19]|nr:MAG: hypothetical protein A3F13_04920 [Gammaproteobacteria bacterium RIFCSPHIGHO2_12_FULL_40_19]HLB41996.1 DUF551 domain-containing protein [Gammaproteobacteria bacterium]